jgi:hypothetical protein
MFISLWLLSVLSVCALVGGFVILAVLKVFLEQMTPSDVETPTARALE